MQKSLQTRRALRTALLVLLLSAAGMGKGYAVIHYAVGNGPEIDSLLLQKEYAGFHDTIGDIEYYFASPHPAAPYKYPYNAAIVVGHADGTEATGPLVIPDSVHWFGNENSMFVPVARIDVGAFAGCSGLTSLTIPNTVEEILYSAFLGCSGLVGELVIPNSVLSIGPMHYYPEQNAYLDPWAAFEGCNFTSVTIKATTPPKLNEEWAYIDPFYGVPCSILTVPCGCISAYEESDWTNHFQTIIEDCSDISENDANDIDIYPNPASDCIHIEEETAKYAAIYNSVGQMMKVVEIKGGSINVSGLSDGVYFLCIINDNGEKSMHKIVIRK